MKNVKKTRRYIRSGFTMVELMAILVIIGLLAAVVATNVIGKIDKAKVTSTKASLRILHSAVTQFKLDTGQFPTEEEGLMALIEPPSEVEELVEPGGYLETTEVPKDGWGNDFYYQLYPASGKPFVIISWGADGEEEGEGYDTDLYSTDAF
ncbi:MAG: type II secretion system major pseudopilin GspG [Planctomycetota bacterium]|jgi:general secretion pathway protein G